MNMMLTHLLDWLEGTLLMSLYIIIALACWFYPKQEPGFCPPEAA